MKRIVLTYGLVSGAVLAAMMFLTLPFMDRIGFEKGEVIGYTTMVVAFLMVFFGVQSYRDTVAGGRVTFGRAFVVGLSIVGVATLCYVAAWQIIYYGVAPDFIDRYTAYALERAREAGASEIELAAQARQMAQFADWYRNPLINIAVTMLEPLPVGVVIALFTAGVVSRKRRPLPGVHAESV